jgi:hypothetical protein
MGEFGMGVGGGARMENRGWRMAKRLMFNSGNGDANYAK